MSRGGRGGGRGGWGSKKNQYGDLQTPIGLSLDYNEKQLYPTLPDLPMFKVLNDNESEIYDTKVKMEEKMKALFYFIEPEHPKPEMERYTDRYTKRIKKASFRTGYSKLKINYEFFPEELQSIAKLNSNEGLLNIDYMARLASLADVEDQGNADKQENEDDSDAEGLQGEDDDEMGDEDNDYVNDYYDSDNDAVGADSDGGGDY
ncbi:hypothetical protein BC833DRAFT_594507 [Globomyces pollinis-pini]|nr:hypothetical protein BC833DRAFT_594507 [Globomyces pollinis-pini]